MSAAVSFEHMRRLKRVEYEKLVELGIFGEERVELLYGVIVEIPPKGPLHDSAIDALNELLVTRLVSRAKVRIQNAFAATDGSQPQPDVAVVAMGDYRLSHPTEAFLIVEVADSSLAADRGTKALLYAESGVPEYWIVDVRHGLIEAHTEIVDGAYTRVTPYRQGESVRVQRFPDLEIAVADIL